MNVQGFYGYKMDTHSPVLTLEPHTWPFHGHLAFKEPYLIRLLKKKIYASMTSKIIHLCFGRYKNLCKKTKREDLIRRIRGSTLMFYY